MAGENIPEFSLPQLFSFFPSPLLIPASRSPQQFPRALILLIPICCRRWEWILFIILGMTGQAYHHGAHKSQPHRTHTRPREPFQNLPATIWAVGTVTCGPPGVWQSPGDRDTLPVPCREHPGLAIWRCLAVASATLALCGLHLSPLAPLPPPVRPQLVPNVPESAEDEEQGSWIGHSRVPAASPNSGTQCSVLVPAAPLNLGTQRGQPQ